MATKQEAIVVDGIHTNLIEPSTGLSVNYKEVLTWWDGTPMTNAKCDGDWFRRKGTKFLRKSIDKEGELFLEKNTMAEMRSLSPLEILFLRGGVYRGVRLSGYYEKGDTPAPIDYFVSNTSDLDDGGSVIDLGVIKLEHYFGNVIHISYFGGLGDFISVNEPYTDNTNIINTALSRLSKGEIVFSKGSYAHNGTIIIPMYDSNNSRGISIKSDSGRLEAGGTINSPQGGTVRWCFSGQEDEAAVRSDALQTWVDFSNLSIRNVSGRDDVDGLVMRDYKGNLVHGLYIGLFRDNLVINGESYYTVFSKCTFSHASRNGVYMNGLVNLCTFRDCRFRLSGEYGIRVDYGGDGINILECFLEGNLKGAYYIRNTRVVNIHGAYIEHNGDVEGPLGGRFSQGYIGAYGNSPNTPVILNLKGSYVLGKDKVDGVNMVTSASPGIGEVTVVLEGNTIPAQHILAGPDSPSEDRTYVVRGQSTSLLNIRLINNKYSRVDGGGMYFPSNYRPDHLNSFYSDGDESVLYMRPEYDKSFFDNKSGAAVKTANIHFLRTGTTWNGSNKDSQTIIRYDAPDLETASLDIRHLSESNTSGSVIEKWYNPETKEIVAELDYKTGRFRGKEIRVGAESDNIRIFTGTALPNGVYSGGVGSIYLHTGPQNIVRGFYYKTTDNSVNTGWELFNPMRKATMSPNTAQTASGSVPTKAEFDALLAELRDLKTKMINANILGG